MLKIYCDGACSNNPGPGAWAYVVFEGEKEIAQATGSYENTTNNRMELMAAIAAARAFDNCIIVLDSKYVKDGITTWVHKWKANGWKTASGKVKNQELWEELDAAVQNKNIKFEWQKGHANSKHDLADAAAVEAVIK